MPNFYLEEIGPSRQSAAVSAATLPTAEWPLAGLEPLFASWLLRLRQPRSAVSVVTVRLHIERHRARRGRGGDGLVPERDWFGEQTTGTTVPAPTGSVHL